VSPIRVRPAEAVGSSPTETSGPGVAGPIHIGGLDRSGKTTIAAFLTSHPNISIPDVGSNMWTYFYGRFGDLGQPENLDRCLSSMFRYTHIRYLEPDPERIRREFCGGPPTYARLFELFLAHHAEREGKPRWGVQTGLIERYADRLFDAYPGVRVIHMVRDPRDRYEASLSLWPEGKGRSGGATARWRYSVRLAERNLRRHPDGYMVVRYEDLVSDTERTLRVVCGFLGEVFQQAMLGMPGAPQRRDKLIARSRETSSDALLSRAYLGRFRGRVAPRELAFIQLHAGRLMSSYGYEPERLDLSVGNWARFAALDWPSQAARMAAWRSVEALGQRFPARFGPAPDRRTIVDEPIGVPA